MSRSPNLGVTIFLYVAGILLAGLRQKTRRKKPQTQSGQGIYVKV